MKNINIIATFSRNYVISNNGLNIESHNYKTIIENNIENKMNVCIFNKTYFENNVFDKDNYKNILCIIIDELKENNSNLEDKLYFQNLNNALLYCKNNFLINEVYIIGNSELYNEALKRNDIKQIYVKYLDKDVLGNEYFPMYFKENYILTINEKELMNEDLYFQVYERSDELQYLNLIRNVLNNGVYKNDRTNSGIISYFGNTMRFNIENSFPLLTTKKMFLRGIIEELLWFINGKTDAKLLQDKNVHIWDGNSSREFLDSIGLTNYETGDCGPIYGFNFRHYGAEYVDCHGDYNGLGYDQLQNIINLIKTNPDSRRILINLWNPCDLNKVVLPPCHVLYQFWVYNGKISCNLYQRSGDIGLGVPFNIASASLLTYIIAHLTGLKPYELIHNIGDGHIYSDHIEALKTQITREPYTFPQLTINNRNQKNIEDFIYEDFKLENYKSHPKISMMMK